MFLFQFIFSVIDCQIKSHKYLVQISIQRGLGARMIAQVDFKLRKKLLVVGGLLLKLKIKS